MAPRRRDWDSLSPAYRKRLSGAGVTRAQYEAGADLRKARGKAPAKNATRTANSPADVRGSGRSASGGGRRVSKSPNTPGRATTKRTRRDWDTLTPAYRKRLQGAGITPEQYESGADLRKARGKGFKAPTPSGFPADSRQRVIDGQSTVDDRRNVNAWRNSPSYPSWLPRNPADMDDQTAAILSTIRPYPNATDKRGRRAGWRNVEFHYNPDGTVTMTVTPSRGYPFAVTLPDSDSAAQVKTVLRNLNTPDIDINHRGEGYSRPTPKSAPTPPAPRNPAPKKPNTKAAPKKAPAANTPTSASLPNTATPKKAPAAAKKAAQKPRQKANTTKKASSRSASDGVRKAPSRKPLGVFDLLSSTIEQAIDTATEAIETAQDVLGL